MSIVSDFHSDRRQLVRLDDKVCASVNVVSGWTQGSILGSLLCILFTSDLCHLVWNSIVDYADDTTIYAVTS